MDDGDERISMMLKCQSMDSESRVPTPRISLMILFFT